MCSMNYCCYQNALASIDQAIKKANREDFESLPDDEKRAMLRLINSCRTFVDENEGLEDGD